MKRLVAATLLALVACATSKPLWVPAGTTFRSASGGYVIDLPGGWMRINEDWLLATHDGTALQEIRVIRRDVAKPFRNTKKTLTKESTPQEAAEVILDDLRTSPAYGGLEVLENGPATLSGQPGFRTAFGFKNGGGLAIRGVVYGAVVGEAFYMVVFYAPRRHYFERDLPIFEGAVRTFRLVPAAPAQSASSM